MIAYNKTWLKNKFIQHQATDAYEANLISREEKEKILSAYPHGLYTPNVFIRIGLFILSHIILSFSLGLLSLFLLGMLENHAGAIAIFYGIITCVALEVIIKEKHHFQSGVDDALLYGAVTALFCGISFTYNLNGINNCILAFLISLAATVRYSDRLMTAVCFIALLGSIFFFVQKGGTVLKSILPFIIMAVSLATYLVVKKKNDLNSFNVYTGCMTVVQILSLFTLYAAGNYFVVRELSNSMFDLHLQPGESIPYGFIFWIFTLAIPFVYIVIAVRKKDRILLRAGLLLIAATVCTVRTYYAVLLPEIAMVLAGVIMILVAWGLSRYLLLPKYGFTRDELDHADGTGKMQLEALVLAQTFSPQPSNEGTQFGGGSFGGGGSSGDY